VIEDSRSANSDVSESAAKGLELRAEKCTPAARQCFTWTGPVSGRGRAAGRPYGLAAKAYALAAFRVLACVVRNAGAV